MSNECMSFRPSPKANDVVKRCQKEHPEKSRSQILNELVESCEKHFDFPSYARYKPKVQIRIMGTSDDSKRILALLKAQAEVSRGDRLFKQITFHKEPSQEEPFSYSPIEKIIYVEMKLRENE